MPSPPCLRMKSGYVYVRFNASRDGIDWPRTGDMPIVIAEGFDLNGNTIPMEDGSIYAGYGMTRQGDEVSIYYTTLPAGHVYPPPPQQRHYNPRDLPAGRPDVGRRRRRARVNSPRP